ncbi:MAG TPA: DivIVA domain-containing protein [Jatrophihabitantaceae bacterium]
MLTLFLYALLAIIVVAGLFALAVYVLPKGEQIAPPTPDTRPWESLPEHQLRPEDVVSARLPVALRGYRFAETDLLLDRLADELRERDDEIARLRGARASIDGLTSTHPNDAYRPQDPDDAYRPQEQQEEAFSEPRLTEASSGDQPAHD